MTYVFVAVLIALTIKLIWDLCRQWVEIAWGWVKYLRARINKKPATALLYMVWVVVIFLLWVFGPDLYELFRVLSYQIKDGGTGDNGDSGIALRYFAFAVAAVGSLAGYFIAIVRNMIADNRNVIAQDKNRIIEQGRITESIGQAITQIGAFNDDKPNIEVRLGGLYSLQRIMQDSPRDTLSIAKIIFAYVRENLKRDKDKRDELKKHNKKNFLRPEEKPFPLPEDIVSALNIISQFKKDRRKQSGVSSTDEIPDFTYADFTNYSIRDIDFSYISFYHADFSGSNLVNVNFSNAMLFNVNFSDTQLSVINFSDAHFFWGKFVDVSLGSADFSGASFSVTDLSGADFTNARNLIQEQVNETYGDVNTRLPAGLILRDIWIEAEKRIYRIHPEDKEKD